MSANCDWNVGVAMNGGGDGGKLAGDAHDSFVDFSVPTSDDPFEFPIGNYTLEGLREAYEEFCVESPAPPPQPQLFTGPVLTPPPPPPVPQCYEPYQGYGKMMNMLHFQDNVQFQNYSNNNKDNVAAVLAGAGAGAGGPPPQNVRMGNTQGGRLRKKKYHNKTYREMTYEELNADAWAWRKYGQKPIKGSPYPRNYYRCSTSKGCAARRQVEKCPNSENYMVWYTGVHTHPRPATRSSLAGTTRNRNGAARARANKAAVKAAAEPNTVNVEEPINVDGVADVETAGGSGDGGSSGEDGGMMDADEMIAMFLNNEEEFEMFPDNAFMVPPWTPTVYGEGN